MRNFLFLFVILTSCKNATNESYVLGKYAEFHKGKTTTEVNDTIVIKDSNLVTKTLFLYNNADQSLKSIKNWLQNNSSPYGHYFKFSKATLTGYYFLCGNDSCHSYEVSNGLDNQPYLERGSACVDFFPPFEIKDSLNDYTLIFTTFPRKSIESSFLRENNVIPLQLKESKLFPFLYEANIICSREELEKGIIIKTKARDPVFTISGLAAEKEFIDTLKTNLIVHPHQ